MNSRSNRRGFVELLLLVFVVVVIIAIIASATGGSTQPKQTRGPDTRVVPRQNAPTVDRPRASEEKDPLLAQLEERYAEVLGMPDEEVKQRMLEAIRLEIEAARKRSGP